MQLGELKIFSGRSNPKLAKAICDLIGMPLGKMSLSTFPDGETFARIDENVRGKDVFLIQSSCPPANDHLMELFIMIDAARRASARRITAVIPFYGYARQDRKDQPRVPITAKLIANLLVTSGANRVLTMDLHAQQIQGFFDIPVDHLYASPVFNDYLQKYRSKKIIVLAPDVGGVKMATVYADLLECDFGFVAKRRTSSSTVEATSLVGDVKDKEVLLIDDMTETAGTLLAATNLIKKHGASHVYAVVTHAVLNDIGCERLKRGMIDELITTDTTPVDTHGLSIIKVLSIADLLAEAILRIHRHKSVSSLFKIKGY
jgi:ribose-phosphate pyrophosphokinase